MKYLLLLLLGTNSLAQNQNQYYWYEGAIYAGSAKINLELKINTEINKQTYGDADIPNHGFTRESVESDVREGKLNCHKTIYLDDITQVATCSGAILEIVNPKILLNKTPVKGNVFLGSSETPIGNFNAKFTTEQSGDHNGNYDE